MGEIELSKTLHIATDVSLQHQHGVITWAFWLKAGNSDIKKAAQFKTLMPNVVGELMAMANALWQADKAFNLAEYDLQLYYDYTGMLNVPMCKDGVTPRKVHTAKFMAIQQHINPYLAKANSYKLNRVKGHNGKAKTTGELMHKWCDQQSRKVAKHIIKQTEAGAPTDSAIFKLWPEAEIIG
jgi:ribonuclease HI